MSRISNFAGEIMKLVGQNELKHALERLQEILQKSPLLNEAVGQSGRLTALMQQIRNGTISYEEAALEENKLRYALIDLVREAEECGASNPAIQQQVEEVLNTPVAGAMHQASLTGDRNIIIQGVQGSKVNIQTKGT
ncbi:MAG: hypothetical protein SFV55_02040 [Haliscomenobacter sp.]|uniref:hypothetical protein n=1 Tax=Haliscomenobacter sp. TaxID=2717303 RepID=UPI0029AB7A23|nr:hypothetical protein [Haliscomenobacter sp.]MDX2067172.1 hypothetical protein [Haliscomenobacter sp.]